MNTCPIPATSFAHLAKFLLDEINKLIGPMDIRHNETQLDAAVHRRYQDWLTEQRRLNDSEYGNRLPVRRIRESGVYDQWRLAQGVAAWLTGQCTGIQITVCVTDAPFVTAWAFPQGPNEKESVIVLTRDGLLAIQRLNILVAAAASDLRNSPLAAPMLGRVLGRNSMDDRTAVAIAQLVGTAVTLFLLFHEAAHILRGHLAAAANESEATLQAVSAFCPTSVRLQTPVGPIDVNDKNVYSRTREFDADVQALYWTRLYFGHLNPALLGDELGSESREVFASILATQEGCRWVTLVAGICFHAAFSVDASRLSCLKNATHPSRQERVELALGSDAAIAIHNHEQPVFLWECVDFVSRMICEDATDDWPFFKEAACAINDRQHDPMCKRIEAARTWLGLSLDDASANSIYQQRLALIESMRRWNPIFESRQPISTMPVLQWWRTT